MFFPATSLGFGAGRVAATISQEDAAGSASNLTEYTFSGMSLGTIADDRIIVVGVCGFVTSDTIDSVTVGGISATTIIEQAVADGFLELWQALVPTGTTGDVVITFSDGVANCAAVTHAIYGATQTVFDTGSDTTDQLSDTLAIPSGGVAVGTAFSANGASASFVWGGLTEDVEQQAGAENTFITGASIASATKETALTVTCDVTNESSGVAMLIASFGGY